MIIQNDLRYLTPVQAGETVSASGTPTAQNAFGARSHNDEASLTATAIVISQSIGTEDLRMDKVASIQAMLASGTYHVSSSDLAAKLIEHMQASNR